MTLYLCLDERNGMRFHNRRQSRDRKLLEDLQACVPETLLMDACSEAMIREAGIACALAPEKEEDFPPNAHFFGEDRCAQLLPLTSRVVIYRWNRVYPADTWWQEDLPALGFRLEQTREFPGYSHETITKEVYVR